jgi:GNAT superfamily N-acetyltransferase
VSIDDFLRTAGLRLVHFEFSPDSSSQQLLLLEGRFKAGWLNYDICRPCQRGHVWKLTIDDEHQHQGVGSHMLSIARQRTPGLRWTTSGQRPEARDFWATVSTRTGAGYKPENPCSCLRNSTMPWRRRVDTWRLRRATRR